MNTGRLTFAIRKDLVRPFHKKATEWVPSMSIVLNIDGVPYITKKHMISADELYYNRAMTLNLVEAKLRDDMTNWLRENIKEAR